MNSIVLEISYFVFILLISVGILTFINRVNIMLSRDDKICKCNNSKKIEYIFFLILPGYLLVIFYQLTKFEATCCNSF